MPENGDISMKNNARRIWNIFTTVLVVVVVLLAVLLVGVRLLGFQIYTVSSSSMEPAYHTGAIIYVRDTDTDKLEIGDVITFRISGDEVATHRIVEIVENDDGRSFGTKGDANETEDGGLISAENIVGKVVFTIPYLGYMAELIQTTRGRWIALGVAAFLMLLVLLPNLLFHNDQGGLESEEKT